MVSTDLLLLEQWMLQLAFHETELGFAIENSLRNLAGVADLNIELDPGMARMKPYQPLRQPVAGNGLAGEYGEPPATQPAQISQGCLGKTRAGQHGLSLAEEQAAVLVQNDASSDPVEQSDRMPLFQGGKCVADSRLGQVQCARRRRHVLAFGDRDENTKLLQRHAINLPNGSFQPY